jgi:hypothetical protein
MAGGAMVSSGRREPVGKVLAEFDFLLDFARRELTAAARARVKASLRLVIDWPRLFALAEFHGLEPLLCWHLSRDFSRQIPAGILKSSQDKLRANLARSLFLSDELLRTLEVLQQNNIEALPFKGPLLARELYGEFVLRQCADVDILLRRRDSTSAYHALVAAGYHPVTRFTIDQLAAHVCSHYELGLISPKGALVELQWGLVPRYFSLPLSFDACWKNPGWTEIGDTKGVGTLSGEDLVWLLCVHGSKHLWSRLIWVADIAQLMQSRPGLNWEDVVQKARGSRAERMLQVALGVSHRLLSSPIPVAMNSITHDKTAERLVDTICQNLLAERQPGYFQSQRLLLLMRERWRDRVRYATRFVFTPGAAEWSLVSLPKPFFPLYSGLRLARGFGKMGRLVLAWLRARFSGYHRA